MGICLSKGNRYHDHALFLKEVRGYPEESSFYSSAAQETPRVSTEADDLSAYNVLFDERGAKLLESDSRRWQVVNVPGCTNKFELQELYEDDLKTKELYGQTLYKQEIYGDVSFSSYLSGPLVNFALDPQDLDTISKLSYLEATTLQALDLMKQHDSSITSPAFERAWSSPMSRVGGCAADRDWIPVVTVESTDPSGGTTDEVVKVKLEKRGRSEIQERGAGRVVREFKPGARIRKEDNFKSSEVAAQSGRAKAGKGEAMAPSCKLGDAGLHHRAGEIGVFGAEKYFSARVREVDEDVTEEGGCERGGGERKLSDMRSDIHETCSSHHRTSAAASSDVHETCSSHHRTSAAASSDVSYDSRSALTGPRKHLSENGLSFLRAGESSRSHHHKVSRRLAAASLIRREVGCKWTVCSGQSSVATAEDGMLDAPSKGRSVDFETASEDPRYSSSSSRKDASSRLGNKLAMDSSRGTRNNSREAAKQEPPLSPSARLVNLLSLRRTSAQNSSSNSWISKSPRAAEAASPKVGDATEVSRGQAVKETSSERSLRLSKAPHLAAGLSAVDDSATQPAKSWKSDSPRSILSLFHLKSESPRNRSQGSMQMEKGGGKGDSPRNRLSSLSLKGGEQGRKKSKSATASSRGEGSPMTELQKAGGGEESPGGRMKGCKAMELDGSPRSRKVVGGMPRQKCESPRGWRLGGLSFKGDAMRGAMEDPARRSGQSAMDEAGAFLSIFLNGGSPRKNKSAPSSSSPIRSAPPQNGHRSELPPHPKHGSLLKQDRPVEKKHREPISERRHSFTFPNPVSLPPSAIPLEDRSYSRSRESRSASPSAPGSPRGDAFGSPFSVAACPSGDYRRRADLIRRLRLYSHERLSSLATARKGLRRDGSSEEFQEATTAMAEGKMNGEMEARNLEPDDRRADQSCTTTLTPMAMGGGDDFDDSDSSSDLFDLESFGADGLPFQSSQLPVYQHRVAPHVRITNDVGDAGAARDPPGYGGFSSRSAFYCSNKGAERCVPGGTAPEEAENGDGEIILETEDESYPEAGSVGEDDIFRSSNNTGGSFFCCSTTINGGEAACDMNLIRRLALLGYKDLDFRGGNDAHFTHSSSEVRGGGGDGVLRLQPHKSSGNSGYGATAFEAVLHPSSLSSSPSTRNSPAIRSVSKPNNIDSISRAGAASAAANHQEYSSWRSSKIYQG